MAKKKTIETKKSKQHLRVVLSRDELLVAGKEQADKAIQLHALEDELKRVSSDYKAKISGVEADLSILANKISSGYEHRMVPCTEYLGDPKPDQKRIVRDDTGETVSVVDMDSNELQRELLNPAEEDER